MEVRSTPPLTKVGGWCWKVHHPYGRERNGRWCGQREAIVRMPLGVETSAGPSCGVNGMSWNMKYHEVS